MGKLSLKNCCSFQEGYVNPTQKNRDYFDGPIKWLRASDLNDGLVYNTERTLSQLGFDSAGKSSFLFKPNTLAISKSGTIGRVGILKDFMCGNRAVINIDVNHNLCDLYYVFYTLKNKKLEIISKAGGSIQKNLYISALETITLNHSELHEQKKIAKVLSDLDAKIEVNNKINKELEAMAKTLYDYWFVQFDFPYDFEKGKPEVNGKPYKSSGGKMVYNKELKRDIPEGWEVKEINKLIEVRDGTHDSPKSIAKGHKLITSKHLKPEGLDFNSANSISDEDYLNINKRSKVDTGDILFSMIGNIGTVYKVDEENIDFAIKNVALFKTSESQNLKNFIYMYLIGYDMQGYMANVISGSIQKFIGLGSLRQIPLIYNEEIISNFNQITLPIFNQINTLKLENQKLAELRDWLLPMLMNGQVSVGEAEKRLSMVAEERGKYGEL